MFAIRIGVLDLESTLTEFTLSSKHVLKLN